MKADQTEPKNIDEYIAGFPKDVQEILEKIRRTIREAAPDAEEAIKYQIPTFTLKGNLVHFAAFKKHIGVFPPVRDPKLKKEVARYAGPKGNLQFPLTERIPYALIGRIAKVRAKANKATAAAKKRERKN